MNACDWVKKQETALVTINQAKPIYVDFSVPEQALSRIRYCLTATGTLSVTAGVLGNEQNPPTGELTLTNFVPGTDAGMMFLRAVFPNKDEMLLPGEHVNVLLTLLTLTNAVVVPSQAVQHGRHGQYVFVVNSNSIVEARPVKVGYQFGSETVLRDGVKFGEKVVISGQSRLATGVEVRIQNTKFANVTMNQGISE